MRDPKKTLLLSTICATCVATASHADGISETNYLHIDPRNAISVFARFPGVGRVSRPFFFDGGKVGRRLIHGRDGQVALALDGQDQANVSIVFDEDICAFGAKIRIDTKGIRNSVKVTFSFQSRKAESVDQELRWPAGGTTLQSFSSDNFASRFAGVQISASADSDLVVSDILALPCAMAVS
ncbi:hypothetical protein [Falsiphaeobacter marinintestinus]|uniref:hypothetical protein n=1 Tax=Falsiphaeobacter marinintestinus TaxID=1492905 RepID=UPI0011B84C3E|nr:hypothetical protein [Phaeobacter marinintestinus]